MCTNMYACTHILALSHSHFDDKQRDTKANKMMETPNHGQFHGDIKVRSPIPNTDTYSQDCILHLCFQLEMIPLDYIDCFMLVICHNLKIQKLNCHKSIDL